MAKDTISRKRKPGKRETLFTGFRLDEHYDGDKELKVGWITANKYNVANFLIVAFLCLFALQRFHVFSSQSKTLEFSKDVHNWRDSGYLFTHQNHEIFYQDIYKMKPFRRTPVLLILHGFPTSSYDWKKIVFKFQKYFGRIIITDMLGFGFSDKPSSHVYSIMEQATINEELLSFLNISKVHILAHDYGDTVAQEMLHRYNSGMYGSRLSIDSLCLSNGGIIPSAHQPRPIQKLFLVPGLGKLLSYVTVRFIFDRSFSQIFGPNTQPTEKDLDDFWSIIGYNSGMSVASNILQYIKERHENEDRWVGALRDTAVPLHLIYGPEDPVNTPEVFLVSYRNLIPNSTVTVLDMIGHYPQFEDPKGFLKSFNSFMKSVFKGKK